MGQAAGLPLAETMAPKKRTEARALIDLGVTEGAEIRISDVEWRLIRAPSGSVLEICLAGCSAGFGTEEWFAVLVDRCVEASGGGLLVGGDLLGSESPAAYREALSVLGTGHLHLCPADPCEVAEEPEWLHCTRVRCWTPGNFDAPYLTPGGRALLTLATMPTPPERGEGRKARPGVRASAAQPKAAAKRAGKRPLQVEPTVIPVLSGGEIEVENLDGEPMDRQGLRSLLKATRERIAGTGGKRHRSGEESDGGAGRRSTGSALAESRLTSGTALTPGRSTTLALAPSADTRGGGAKRLKKRLEERSDNTSRLLAQAVQTSERESTAGEREKEKEKVQGRDCSPGRTTVLRQEEEEKKEEERSGPTEERTVGPGRRRPRRQTEGEARPRRPWIFRLKWLRQQLDLQPKAKTGRRHGRGFRAVLRGSPSPQGLEGAGKCDGHVGEERAGSVRPGVRSSKTKAAPQGSPRA